MCAVRNMAVCCSSLILCFRGMMHRLLLLLLLLLELSHVMSAISIFISLVEVVGTSPRISGPFAGEAFSVEIHFLFCRFRRVWDS